MISRQTRPLSANDKALLYIHFLLLFSVIEIDLLSQNFLPGNGFYDRVYRCFTENKQLSSNCLLAWDSHGKETKGNIKANIGLILAV